MQDMAASEAPVVHKHGARQITAAVFMNRSNGTRGYEILWDNNIRSWETESSVLKHMDNDTFQELLKKFNRTSKGKSQMQIQLRQILRKRSSMGPMY